MKGVRCISTTLAVGLALMAAPEARAHDSGPGCTARTDPVSGQVETSPNVDHLGWLPGEAYDMTAGGRLVGDYFYVTGLSHFSIYDVTEPATPRLVSRVNFPCRFENEDVAVDGRSLIYSDFATNQSLFVYDIRDKREPKLAAEVPLAGTHTSSCVLACRYLFGSYKPVSSAGPTSTGQVVDLADPAKPKVLGDWTDNGVLPSRKVHDVTEIAPGLVLSGSAPIQLMDVRANPVKPAVLARTPDASKRYHSVDWPRQGLDRWMLASFETNATQRCEAGVGDFTVFDAGRAAETGKLEPANSYFLQNENDEKSSGNPAVNTGLGCSPHWFETRPGWRDGGVVGLAAYDHGTKFLRVDGVGNITEVGHFRPPGTNASGAYWISCDIVYVVDYTRGLDVLRFKDAATDCKPGDPPPAGASLPSHGNPAGAAPPTGTAPGGADPVGPNATGARLERLSVRIRARWRPGRRFTRLRSLTIRGLPVAASVQLRCRGRGCPVKRRGIRVRQGRAVASRALRRLRFRPGAFVEIRVSRPGAFTEPAAWRMRSSRKPRPIRLR